MRLLSKLFSALVCMLISGVIAPACAQNSDLVPSSARIDPAAYQRVVDENLELRKAQVKAEAECGELRRNNASLLVDIQDLERRKTQLTLLMSQLKTPEETKADLARLQSEKQVLIREIDRLHRALADVTPPASNAVPVSAPALGSDLFRKIEKENADLRQDLAKTRELLQVGTAAKASLEKSQVSQQAEFTRLSESVRKYEAELDVARRQDASMKKALESQARKAFEADSVLKAIKDEQARKKQEELAAKANKMPAVPGKRLPEAAKQVDLTAPSAQNLMRTARQCLLDKKAKEAEQLYLQALQLEPANSQVNYNLGVLYGDYLSEPKKAAGFYRMYLKLNPRASDSAAVRGWIMELDARAR